MSGQLVDVLAHGFYGADNYSFTWNAQGMATGIYVIHAEFNNETISHNISLIK